MYLRKPDGIDLVVDFTADIDHYFREELRKLGYAPQPSMSPSDVGMLYFNARRRRIDVRPRTVEVSRELSRKLPRLVDAERKGLRVLKRKIQGGKDLYPHLSRFLQRLKYHDRFLNDWGIFHFHLGLSIDIDNRDGYIDRTESLLFAWVTKETIYFIDVLTHDDMKVVDWAKNSLIETLHANWPELLARYKMNGFLAPERSLTDAEHGRLRKSGGSTLLFVSDGTCYAPPGGGMASAGNSIDIVRAFDHTMWHVEDWERRVKAEAASWVEAMKSAKLDIGERLVFKLIIENDVAYAEEQGTKFRVPLGQRMAT